MEDLIKIASNGQWTLEKARKSDTDVQRMIEEFMAQKKKPAQPKVTPATNLQPVKHNTGDNPLYSKEQVAAIRAGIPEDVVAKMPAAIKQGATSAQKHANKVSVDMNRMQQQADEKAKVTQDRKAAWEAGVAFLARHGDKGYQALQQQMKQRKVLDAAHQSPEKPFVKPEVNALPPQIEGSFHNQGMETSGKIVHKPVGFEDKITGEKRYSQVPQQERHLWRWDHNNKKWNHVKTTLGNPNR